MNGRRRAARPLSASSRALTPKQAMTEADHQRQLFAWLDFWARRVPQFARTYHVANEFIDGEVTRDTKRGRVTYSPGANYRHKLGVRNGVLDTQNHGDSPRSPELTGLFIELKARDGELTRDVTAEWDQVREIEWLRSQNKSAHVVWSWAEAAVLHAWYFDAPPEVWKSIGPLDVYLLPRLGGHDRRCDCYLPGCEMFLKRFTEAK